MKRIGLIGYPLEHSFSQRYFTEKFAREGIQGIRYDNYPIQSIDAFPALIEQRTDLVGLNVTIPYKTSVITYLDELDAHAEKIGAVNTVRIENGRTIGYNTDWIGFRNSLKKALSDDTRRALILGSGGASKGIAYALEQMGLEYDIASRTPAADQLHYDDLRDFDTFQLIVNCTPLGTAPDTASLPPLPYDQLSPQHLLFDLVYNPPLTAFMKEGKKAGARTFNGYEMLIHQAEEAWKIWMER